MERGTLRLWFFGCFFPDIGRVLVRRADGADERQVFPRFQRGGFQGLDTSRPQGVAEPLFSSKGYPFIRRIMLRGAFYNFSDHNRLFIYAAKDNVCATVQRCLPGDAQTEGKGPCQAHP
jgi:hypothetical protein